MACTVYAPGEDAEKVAFVFRRATLSEPPLELQSAPTLSHSQPPCGGKQVTHLSVRVICWFGLTVERLGKMSSLAVQRE